MSSTPGPRCISNVLDAFSKTRYGPSTRDAQFLLLVSVVRTGEDVVSGAYLFVSNSKFLILSRAYKGLSSVEDIFVLLQLLLRAFSRRVPVGPSWHAFSCVPCGAMRSRKGVEIKSSIM